MEAQGSKFSFQERAAAKSAARAKDEELLRNGQISHAAMARANGGALRGSRYKGPSKRIQALTASWASD